jgi:hypothetical protein
LIHTKERQGWIEGLWTGISEFLVRGLYKPPHFYGVRQCWQEDRLVYSQFVVEGKFRSPTQERCEETEFSVAVSPFQSCVAVLNMLSRVNIYTLENSPSKRNTYSVF